LQTSGHPPILDFDPSREAIIEPTRHIAPIGAPEHCVFCFFHEVIDALVAGGRTREIRVLCWEDVPRTVYELDVDGRRVAIMHPGVGSPVAAASLEAAIALGCRKFVACGGAGVLDRTLAVGHLLVPQTAVRDEGTSYHYLAPGEPACASADAVAAIEATLRRRGVPYLVAPTWTTDGVYRETPAKVRMRREQGCLSVDMEAAAFFAVAQFRGVPFGQILYGGDDVSGSEWDRRGWNERTTVREGLFWLAVEACLSM
jgi:uridine phosphorylase